MFYIIRKVLSKTVPVDIHMKCKACIYNQERYGLT